MEKEEALIVRQREHDVFREQLQAIELQIAEKEADIERMRRERECMREEKLAIEEKRVKRENELQEQHLRFHGLMAEEFENSFKDNAVVAVDDIEERNDWREDDTSYDDD